MNRITKDLMAASSIPMLLNIIKAQETYGYEIIQKIRDLSEGNIEWKDGSLYPVLKKLEQKELIRSVWRQTPAGKKRKYYNITMKGRNELNAHESQWRFMYGMLDRMWTGKSVDKVFSS